jgi:hypothetical protein
VFFNKAISEEILAAIRADSDLTCKNVRKGVYVVRDGDTACFAGEPLWSHSIEVDGRRYEVYIGGY